MPNELSGYALVQAAIESLGGALRCESGEWVLRWPGEKAEWLGGGFEPDDYADCDLKTAEPLLERWLEQDGYRLFECAASDGTASVRLSVGERSFAGDFFGSKPHFTLEAAMATAICRALVAAGGE